MTKSQVVWLITKLIGVYFAYSAIVAVPDVISSVYHYASLPSPPRFAKNENPANNAQTVSPINPTVNNPSINNPAVAKTEAETPAEKAKNDALKLFLWNLFSTIFYGLIGWYLIRDGRFLSAVLNREEPFDESGKPVASDSFPLSKKKEEVVTSLNLSGGKEEITSLNLSDTKSEQAPPPEPPPAPLPTPPAVSFAQPTIAEEPALAEPANVPDNASNEFLNDAPSDEHK
jgi:hypothetical protein